MESNYLAFPRAKLPHELGILADLHAATVLVCALTYLQGLSRNAPAQDVISSFGLNIFNILQIGESLQVPKYLLIDFLYYEGTHGRNTAQSHSNPE